MARILMLASNPATSPVTGWPIGFWWAELSHAYEEFIGAGHDVTIVSPKGGKLAADGYSDPDDESGYSAQDTVSRAFKAGSESFSMHSFRFWRDWSSGGVIEGAATAEQTSTCSGHT